MYKEEEIFLGKTAIKVEAEDEKLTIEFEDVIVTFQHHQDCCEYVYIEDICGDLSDLVDSPFVEFETVEEDDPHNGECGMWTFYRFGTMKGHVVVRWYGSSNGYYGVGVSMDCTKK